MPTIWLSFRSTHCSTILGRTAGGMRSHRHNEAIGRWTLRSKPASGFALYEDDVEQRTKQCRR